MPDPAPERSRFLTVLGILCLLMAAWGGYFVTVAYDMFDQMVSRSGPAGGPYVDGPRPAPEPWVLTYCAASSLLMLAAGIGLLGRRRWGPTVAALAGSSWTLSSFAAIWSQVRLLRGYIFSPAELRLWHQLYTGGAIVTLIFGLICLSCLLRPSVREECGMRPPGWISRLSLLLWAGVALFVTNLWRAWYWEIWGFKS